MAADLFAEPGPEPADLLEVLHERRRALVEHIELEAAAGNVATIHGWCALLGNVQSAIAAVEAVRAER